MAITVLDVRDSFGAAPARVPLRLVPALAQDRVAEEGRRLLPVTVAAAALAAGLEAVALLAAGLTGLDGVLTSPARPGGPVVALGLVVLATWIVLSAGGGAALLDAAGNRLFRGVCYAEYGVIGTLLLLTLTTGLFDGVPAPVAAFELLALAVPTGKLLLAGAPAATQWVAQGPRPREHRPDPVARHRALCVATMAAIGLTLGGVALVAPVQHSLGPLAATDVGGHRPTAAGRPDDSGGRRRLVSCP